MSEDCAETCGRRVRTETESQVEVGEGSDGASGEECFEAVKSVLAVCAPMEDRILLGQGMQWNGGGCEVFYIAPVIAGETQEGADFGGVFGRANLTDGGEQREVR